MSDQNDPIDDMMAAAEGLQTPPRAATTVAAAVLDLLVTAFYAVLGLLFSVTALVFRPGSGRGGPFGPFGRFVTDGDATRFRSALVVFAIVGGIVVLGLCAWTLMLGLGILRRAAWARWGATITFGVFALGIGRFAVFGGMGPRGGPRRMGGPGLLLFAVEAAIPILLWLPSTSADFRRANRPWANRPPEDDAPVEPAP